MVGDRRTLMIGDASDLLTKYHYDKRQDSERGDQARENERQPALGAQIIDPQRAHVLAIFERRQGQRRQSDGDENEAEFFRADQIGLRARGRSI